MKFKHKEYSIGFKIEAKFLQVKTNFGIVRVREREILRNYHRVLKNGKSLTMEELLKFQHKKYCKKMKELTMTPLFVGRTYEA